MALGGYPEIPMIDEQMLIVHQQKLPYKWPYKWVTWVLTYTLPETNIAPTRKPSQKENSLPTIHFQVLC